MRFPCNTAIVVTKALEHLKIKYKIETVKKIKYDKKRDASKLEHRPLCGVVFTTGKNGGMLQKARPLLQPPSPQCSELI